MKDDTLYTLENVCKSFPMAKGKITVLENLSLQIQKGEWVSLTGRSGCGKTTLLHLLGGLDRPSSGTVLLEKQPFSTLSAACLTELRRRRIGFIFQSYHLFPELSSLENAVLPALHWGNDRKMATRKAAEWLEKFGLGERKDHRPRELSGGEQQRVAIARALINEPDIILADEPTGNLDKKAAQDIIAILKETCRSDGKTLIMVTHDPEIAASADRTITIQKIKR